MDERRFSSIFSTMACMYIICDLISSSCWARDWGGRGRMEIFRLEGRTRVTALALERIIWLFFRAEAAA
eukprot:1393080-Amorphochlora_amoeboformis.AAC.2